MMTDSASTNVGSKIPHQELVRNVDTEPPEVDPLRPLHDACDRLCVQKPKNDLEMQRLVSAGMSLRQLFEAATLSNARAFGLDGQEAYLKEIGAARLDRLGTSWA